MDGIAVPGLVKDNNGQDPVLEKGFLTIKVQRNEFCKLGDLANVGDVLERVPDRTFEFFRGGLVFQLIVYG